MHAFKWLTSHRNSLFVHGSGRGSTDFLPFSTGGWIMSSISLNSLSSRFSFELTNSARTLMLSDINFFKMLTEISSCWNNDVDSKSIIRFIVYYSYLQRFWISHDVMFKKMWERPMTWTNLNTSLWLKGYHNMLIIIFGPILSLPKSWQSPAIWTQVTSPSVNKVLLSEGKSSCTCLCRCRANSPAR